MPLPYNSINETAHIKRPGLAIAKPGRFYLY